MSSNLELVAAQQVFCADELRWARTLRPDETLSTLVELGSSPRLTLAGCLARADNGGELGPVSLEVAFSVPEGPSFERTLSLPIYSRAWEEGLEIEGLPEGTARLNLTARLPEGRRLVLTDFSLAHQVVAAPRPDPAPPQVLLISVDTLRADAIGALGGPWPTPHLDRLVADSEVWEPHYAASHWTKPSHASLLTGQSPEVHGAGAETSAIRTGVPNLAERFRAAGFFTGGLVFDCLWLNARFGFSRGFDEYRWVHWNLPQMTRHAGDWMSEHRDQPFFFFFHTFEVHSDFHRLPYEAPETTRAAVEESFDVERYGCREQACASGLLMRLASGEIEPLPEEPDILRFLYGRGVAHLDASLGELFERLDRDGLYDDLLIVLTSDHGEALLEHPGATLHSQPWEEVQRVPLIVKWPGGRAAGQRRDQPTSSLDVAPTLLAEFGLDISGLPGAVLGQRRPDRPVFSWGAFRTVWADGMKGNYWEFGDRWHLFDLAADPTEKHNLAEDRPADRDRLRELIETRRALDEQLIDEALAAEPVENSTLSPEERERLEALGYLGGS